MGQSFVGDMSRKDVVEKGIGGLLLNDQLLPADVQGLGWLVNLVDVRADCTQQEYVDHYYGLERNDDEDWCFVHMVGRMGRSTSKGNEAKSKMKHASDMPTPRFEFRC